GRTQFNAYAVARIGQGRGPGGIRADEVSRDNVSRRAGVGDVHAIVGVAGDDVGGAGRRPADRVVVGALTDVDAIDIAACRGPCRVGADVIALDKISRCPRAVQPDPGQRAAGDYVARARSRAADQVIGRVREENGAADAGRRVAIGAEADPV